MRCLALNASFEPLTMVPVRRALRLVIEGKAEIVESDANDVVRSERLTLPKPAINEQLVCQEFITTRPSTWARISSNRLTGKVEHRADHLPGSHRVKQPDVGDKIP